MTIPVLFAVLAILVVGIVLLTVLLGMWQRPTRTRLSIDGFQELEVVVKGHYLPDLVEAKRGIPVRLQFRREEDTPCSERVIFSDFHVGARLPAYETTAVSFIPTKCGEFLFTCAFGMYQGRLVVVEPGKRDLERARAAGSRDLAMCIMDSEGITTPVVATANYGYFRLRDKAYEPADIHRWATTVLEQSSNWQDAFVYFKHESAGKGAEFARIFLDFIRP